MIQPDLTLDDVIARYGEWSAMGVYLGEGKYTLPNPSPDRRLSRLLQIVSDVSSKPLADLRVADLACLEGHYGIEFAMHGAEVIAIEGREANVAKTQFAIKSLGLSNISVETNDVRNFSVSQYGRFDVIICSGILYHLPAFDVLQFVQNMYDACDSALIIDTHIGMSPSVSVDWNGARYSGSQYQEHFESSSQEEKLRDLWASLDNNESFWITEPSLCNLVERIGFTSLFKCLNPIHRYPSDRATYVALKGKVAKVKTSPVTAEAPTDFYDEGAPEPSHVQRRRSWVHRTAKNLFPQSLKNMIKPPLRKLGILEDDHTPDFLRK